jgi:hypothetical protein
MAAYLPAGLFHAAASLGIAKAAARRAATAVQANGAASARGRMLLAENAVELTACRATLSRAAALVDTHDGPDADVVALFGEAQAAKTFVNAAAERVSAARSSYRAARATSTAIPSRGRTATSRPAPSCTRSAPTARTTS